jgi:very-short-patch-repair endonuclease
MRTAGTGAQARRTHPEQALLLQFRAAKLPEPTEQHLFGKAIGRRWRFDFAWLDRMLAVEVEGGVYVQGRHTRGSGFTADIEKYNAATLMGWRVLRVTPEHIRTGAALRFVEEAMSEPAPACACTGGEKR